MVEANNALEPVAAALNDDDDDDGAPLPVPVNDVPKTINDLPKELIVSIFYLFEDQSLVRRTMPLVCKEWAEIYRTKDASPLHETLEVNPKKEVAIAKAA